jgi:hypothetical protein
VAVAASQCCADVRIVQAQVGLRVDVVGRLGCSVSVTWIMCRSCESVGGAESEALLGSVSKVGLGI